MKGRAFEVFCSRSYRNPLRNKGNSFSGTMERDHSSGTVPGRRRARALTPGTVRGGESRDRDCAGPSSRTPRMRL